MKKVNPNYSFPEPDDIPECRKVLGNLKSKDENFKKVMNHHKITFEKKKLLKVKEHCFTVKIKATFFTLSFLDNNDRKKRKKYFFNL